MPRKDVRPRGSRVEVWLTPEEKVKIDQQAGSVGLSNSAYLRNLGLGYSPKGRYDREAFRELIRLHADQGRLGGLLKLWLSEKPGEGASVRNVRELLQKIEGLQQMLILMIRTESLKSP